MIYYFPKYFYTKAIVMYVLVLLIVTIASINYVMPLIWFFTSSLTIFLFFYFLHTFSKDWANYSDKIFRKKVFLTAFAIRVVIVTLMYFLFEELNGEPFEFDAADAHFYDDIASEVSDGLSNLDFSFYENSLARDIGLSDRGFPIYLGIVYSFVFKSILMARFVNGLLGAWSCVLIYDFTKRNFNEAIAKLAAIIMMLSPNLIYYAGLHLKETVMVFFVIAAINYADQLMKTSKPSANLIVMTSLAIFSLFMFRTVLAAAVLFSFVFSTLVQSERVTGNSRKSLLFFLFVLMAGYIYTSSLMDDVNIYMKGASGNQDAQLKHFSKREGGNKLAKYGTKLVFAPLILSAPFPTLVDTGQENQMMISGAVFTHSIYAFFAITAVFLIIKRRLWRRYSLILAFVASYLGILTFSAFVLSERFHLPILPFIAILTAYGIYCINNSDKKYIKYYIPYLIFIAFVIIGWNWFKLAGRGMM